MIAKIEALIAELTLEEKASLLSGANFWNTKSVERLGIPAMMLTDGPHGLRKQGGAADHLGLNKSIPATCFPTASALANSWDTALLEQVGACLGSEAAAEHVSVLLGPGLNLKRNPLGGRNFEYFSEDPYLSGKLAAALIKGIQSQGISACAKHYAVNSQETYRMAVDEIVDERALHELYLEGFRYAVTEGGARTVMTSYNQVNGSYANENYRLLQEVLREQWGFDGMVVSDWGGNNDRVAAVQAGSSLEMPATGGYTDADVVEAVRSGEVDELVIDARVREVLSILYEAQPHLGVRTDLEAHHKMATRAAEESLVLLRNDGILPLEATQRVAVVGDFAANPRYQGAGSSLVNPTQLTSAWDALTQTNLHLIGYEPGFERSGKANNRLRHQAVELAQRADVVLAFIGLDESRESEGKDRDDLHLAYNQLLLLSDLVKTGVPVVVVLSGGAPIELPFEEHVSAILHGYLAGQGGGTAIANVLTGLTNPSGKLAETYPLRYEDVPSAPWYLKTQATAEHRESIYVGYRYFDKIEQAVRYPFGFGLSYTQFTYAGLSVSESGAQLTVTNTGRRAGAEIVQLYVSPADHTGFVAVKELKAFAKVYLEPRETRTVHLVFDEHTFGQFSPELGRWATFSGDYEVLVGASSRDIRLTQKHTVIGEDRSETVVPSPYLTGWAQEATAEDFEKLLGRHLPNPNWDPKAELTWNSLVAQAHGPLGGLLHCVLNLSRRYLLAIGKPIEANYTAFLSELPFRAFTRMSAGKVSPPMLDGILELFNGRYRAGLRDILREGRNVNKE